MNIDKKQKDELDLAFNESTINYVGIESDSVEILLSCISMNADKEFPDDNRLKIVFSDYGRIAISYRKGTWDDENAEIEETWAGQIDVTPDSNPVIDRIASIPGLTIATGFSGHGFGTGPASGQLAADLVTDATPLVDPKPYTFDRL